MNPSYEEQSCIEWAAEMDHTYAKDVAKTPGTLFSAEKRVTSNLPQLNDGHRYMIRSWDGRAVKSGTTEDILSELVAIRLGATDHSIYRIWTRSGNS